MEPNKNPNPNMNASNKNTDVDPNPHPNDWKTLSRSQTDTEQSSRCRGVQMCSVWDCDLVSHAYKSLLRSPDNNKMSSDYLFKYKRSVVEFEFAAFKEATNETDYLSGIFRRMDAMMTKYLSAHSSSNSKPSNGNDGSNTQEGQEANDRGDHAKQAEANDRGDHAKQVEAASD